VDTFLLRADRERQPEIFAEKVIPAVRAEVDR
jgi:hypothetical protein